MHHFHAGILKGEKMPARLKEKPYMAPARGKGAHHLTACTPQKGRLEYEQLCFHIFRMLL